MREFLIWDNAANLDSPYAPSTMLKIRDLEAAMERITPSALAEDWDNVGLLAGDRSRPLRRIMLCSGWRRCMLMPKLRVLPPAKSALLAFPPVLNLMVEGG